MSHKPLRFMEGDDPAGIHHRDQAVAGMKNSITNAQAALLFTVDENGEQFTREGFMNITLNQIIAFINFVTDEIEGLKGEISFFMLTGVTVEEARKRMRGER